MFLFWGLWVTLVLCLKGSDYWKSHSGPDLGSRLGTGLFFCMCLSLCAYAHVRREASKTGVYSLQNPPHGSLNPTYYPAGGRWWERSPPFSTPPHCSPLPPPINVARGRTHARTHAQTHARIFARLGINPPLLYQLACWLCFYSFGSKQTHEGHIRTEAVVLFIFPSKNSKETADKFVLSTDDQSVCQWARIIQNQIQS